MGNLFIYFRAGTHAVHFHVSQQEAAAITFSTLKDRTDVLSFAWHIVSEE